ncbi:MAG TPA: sporulation protein [Candidatus Evtepia faecigallinarum]|nr:sporulation protein [Candidatus Evtepia faecigallinarum]
MRTHIRTLLEGTALVLLGVLLFRFPEASAAAAREGVTLCLDLIVPSLFPFFVLSSLLIATGLAGACARPLEKLMGPLFGVGGAGAAALGLGLIGGYPVGARTIAQLTERGECTPAEARRLAQFCNNCGPAFFIGAAGVGVFGSKEAGFLLLGANLTAALLLGIGGRVCQGSLLPRQGRDVPPVSFSALADRLPQCVTDGFSATLGVCAYVILFSVLAAVAEASSLLPLATQLLAGLLPGEGGQELCRSFLMGFLELSTGTASLSDAPSPSLALPLAAFLLGWGGLSVHCQSLPFLRAAGVATGPYLRAKFLQGMLSAGLTALALLVFPLSLPAMAPALPLVCPIPFARQIVVLWALAGAGFFLARQKKLEKAGYSRYNGKVP